MEKVVLLADPKSNSWSFTKKIKDYLKQEKKINVPVDAIEITGFRNQEFRPRVPENIRGKDVYFIQDSTKEPCRWWVELLLIKDLLLNSSAEKEIFVLPDLLWSRQDRKDMPHVPISARALAESLAYPSSISRLISVDIHADQIQGFYKSGLPFDSLHSFPSVVHFLKEGKLISHLEKLVIVSPDAGGVKRAKTFAKQLKSKYPIALIYKDRAEPGEIENMTLVGDVRNKDVFIVDDIIDSGNTQVEAAQLLVKHGAKKLYCYGTHGLFTKGTEELKKYFELIMTSNTHYKGGNNVKVVDLSPLFAETIYRAQTGESISELFLTK